MHGAVFFSKLEPSRYAIYYHLNCGIRCEQRGPMLGQNENGDQGQQLNTKPSTDTWDTSGSSNVSGRQEQGLLNVGLNKLGTTDE